MIPWVIPIGDLLLKSVATKLRDILHANRPYCATWRRRICDFADVGPQPGSSIALAEKIIEIVGQPCNIDGHDVTVGASVGIAVAHPGDMNTENFLKSADLAMYSAKSDGRGTYRMFDPANGCDRSGAPHPRARNADRACAEGFQAVLSATGQSADQEGDRL